MYFPRKEGFYTKHHAQVQLSDEDLRIVDNCNYQVSLGIIKDSSQLTPTQKRKTLLKSWNIMV
jgi:hypothetical protein